MDRSTGTPLGFALLLLFAYAFGWVAWNGHGAHDGNPALASFSDQNADQAEPALVWPNGMPQPLQSYEGLRVNAFGLRVTGVDADEGFWVEKAGRRAWVQLQTLTESPYTVRVGDTVSLTGRVLPHSPDFPSKIFFCPGRTVSATELSRQPEHLAVLVDSLKFGTG
jgi:hypothetical protein